MASVNATRSKLSQNVHRATNDAKLIGFNDDGEACCWYGGPNFTVYDAATEWQEVRHFTSGDMYGLTDRQCEEAYEKAKMRMLSEGFPVIE